MNRFLLAFTLLLNSFSIWADTCTYDIAISRPQDDCSILDATLDNRLPEFKKADADWIIVGAGPAGIITVGILIDIGVAPERIIWLDPEFNVGRLSSYPAVPANNKTKFFIEFVNSCSTFKECKCDVIDKLNLADPSTEHPLGIVIEPLKAIVKHLTTKVHAVVGQLDSLFFENQLWHVGVGTEKVYSSTHVVLATGSYPKRLDYNCKNEIPLDIALDPAQLKQVVNEDDTVVVVGSSHSAILLLKFLSELKVRSIINLYKNPLKYAVDMGSWILNSSTGLNGATARWAHEVLEKNPPKNILRLKNTKENREEVLKQCTKIIYAVGFERNSLPTISQNPKLTYDETSGVIAPRLFGIGIAFPEKIVDPFGNIEYKVGLTSFMRYAQRVIPQWVGSDIDRRSRLMVLEEKLKQLEKFEDLFTVSLL